MTDHKFTDDDVIKALEYCLEDVANCNNCPYERYCDMHENNMVRDTLALINRQKAEIEMLNKTLSEQFDSYENIRKKAKSEAIKDFAERLCEGRVSNDPVVIAAKCLLKEMIEEAEL